MRDYTQKNKDQVQGQDKDDSSEGGSSDSDSSDDSNDKKDKGKSKNVTEKPHLLSGFPSKTPNDGPDAANEQRDVACMMAIGSNHGAYVLKSVGHVYQWGHNEQL